MYRGTGKRETKFIEVETGTNFITAYDISELLPNSGNHLKAVRIPDYNKTFGEYFFKCCGELNSVRKVAESTTDVPFVNTPICKQYIGFIPLGRANAVYMYRPEMILTNLSEAHVKLISKKSKREVVADFVAWKAELNVRTKNIQQKIIDVIPEVISWTKILNVFSKDSARSYGNHNIIGLTKKETVIVKKSLLTIDTLREPTWMMIPESSTRVSSTPTSYSNELGLFVFTIKNNDVDILTIDIRQKYNHKMTLKINNYGHDISTIDFVKMLDITSDGIVETLQWIETSLDALREKHLTNFVLNSIGGDNCAI